MKKFLLLLVAVFPQGYAQCTEPVAVPYFVDSEQADVAQLPDCWDSFYNSFTSNEIFETTEEPIAGFEGKVIAYNTIVDNEFLPPDAPVNAYLLSPYIFLEQDVEYIVSYKYGNSDSSLAIGNLIVAVEGEEFSSVTVGEHTNITGAEVISYTSGAFTVPASGQYKIFFTVYSQGSQGLLYLDDITILEAPTMGTSVKEMNTLSIYPNPADNIININNNSGIEKIEINAINGQRVLVVKPLSSTTAIDVSFLSGGVYIVTIYSDGVTENLKLIKR